MASVNKAIIIGHLGRDPEIRSFQDGTSVANLAVATSESWKDKNTGEKKEATEWHRVSVTGKLADICGQYLRKGSQVYIEGSIRTRKWTDQQTGQERYATEIRADQMRMLDKRGSDEGSYAGYGYDPQPQQQQQAPARAPAPASAPRQAPAPQRAQSGFDDMDDSIPF